MHYERIYPYLDGKGLSWNPAAIRREILELLSWMSLRAGEVIQRLDRLPDVMNPATLRYLRRVPWRF